MRTETRTETDMDSDRNRDTDGHGQGHRQTGTRTQTDRDADGQVWRHKGTGKGTQMDTDRNMNKDIDNYNGQLFFLQKSRALKALSLQKIRQNIILSAYAINRFKNMRSSVKLTFSK
jgi:hypothetical protein